ncbi:MAG: DUF3326 domain-containing protein [bacterium]|nr:DUF3326 domain-containing protein [bacterium]
MRHEKTVAISIPTGVGAQIGGFAGDGGKIAKMFSKHFNVLVHPNVVNGGILSGMNPNILYAEGFAYDEFFKGNISLIPLGEFEENKIGVIFDKSIPDEILNVHLNTISAAKEVMGLDIPYYEITKEEAGVEFFIKNEISTGILRNEKTLLDSAKNLIKKGCNAIAVVCYFNDDADDEKYEEGTGVDPIGGIEAVISHYLTKELMIPIAHAPAFSEIEISKKISNPKVASENISSTYLPCILTGLSKAPAIDKKGEKGLKNKDIEALIIPYKAFGGIAPLAALENGISVIAVKNEIKGGLSCKDIKANGIIEYESYEDCLKALI